MHLSKKSQSIIEFSSLIILVMITIVLMGPYVRRAINAHFRSWEVAVEDSMQDPLEEADPEENPNVEFCGDTRCTGSETLDTCCQDCGGGIGDGYCCEEDGETVATANYDCGSCGDGTCGDTIQGPEDESQCCIDCPGCPNQICCVDDGAGGGIAEPTTSTTGTPLENCLEDCPQLAVCPDGTCSWPVESVDSCCQDCGDGCPNGYCCRDAGEDNANCPQDCAPPACGCLGETDCRARSDCQWAQIGSSCGGSMCMIKVDAEGNRSGWCCSPRGAGGPCAGVNCSSRSASECCSNNCCSRHINELGQTCYCGRWEGVCMWLERGCLP